MAEAGRHSHLLKTNSNPLQCSGGEMAAPVVQLSRSGEIDPSTASLKGRTLYARGSTKPVYNYVGIPYAQPPINHRRFRPPQELPLWSGTRDATTFGPACPQDVSHIKVRFGHLPDFPSRFSEDCLYLNVWTPVSDPQQQKLPVMVWIYGGAFIHGFSDMYNGSPLAAYEDVVVVSFNYRIGVLGFLRTGSGPDDYHGNQGLLDQLEALRWVQRYIHNFGGDAQNVTVFGLSAGGMSISYHMTSPLAKGLFHKAIIQSGPCMLYNGVWSAEGTEKYFWKRIERMGYRGRDSKEVVRFLSTKSTDELLSTFNDWFVPSVQDGTYLPQYPAAANTKGPVINCVDLMMGFSSTEGLSFVSPLTGDRESAVRAITDHICNNFFRGFPPIVQKEITDLAIREYLSQDTDNFVEPVSDMYGDINYVASSLLQAELHSAHTRCYTFFLDHRPFFSSMPDWVRASHGDEVPYVFGYPYRSDLPDNWPEEERKLSRSIMSYWASFARTGNPNGNEDTSVWNQFSSDSPLYMKLTVPQCTLSDSKHLWPSRMRLWNKTVPEIIVKYSHTKAKY